MSEPIPVRVLTPCAECKRRRDRTEPHEVADVIDVLRRWHGEQDTVSHPGGFDLCPASPCADVRQVL